MAHRRTPPAFARVSASVKPGRMSGKGAPKSPPLRHHLRVAVPVPAPERTGATELAAPRYDWREIARRGGIATAIWAVPSLAIVVLAWHALPLSPGPGLDESWRAGLHMAAHYGLPFGNQLVFTYGPLGFLDVNELWYGSTGGLAFAYALLLRGALAAALFAAARRNYGFVFGWLVALVV